jgi:hypothetical protein
MEKKTTPKAKPKAKDDWPSMKVDKSLPKPSVAALKRHANDHAWMDKLKIKPSTKIASKAPAKPKKK